ncbi:AAA family ATPase [Planoprotostelium fungivorum]|uniref:AAA family ATPase n=1 Tax=Planoprotostelium fungivorum TaxID=1890364 RepID=A0A2P6NLH3_9EUKA|nr:AAA family ATPase [Planoprotostelium fungivorum]
MIITTLKMQHRPEAYTTCPADIRSRDPVHTMLLRDRFIMLLRDGNIMCLRLDSHGTTMSTHALKETFSKLKLETLNRILEGATQEQQKDVSAAVEEVANAVVHGCHLHIVGAADVKPVCAILRIKGTQRSLTDYLRKIDIAAFFKKMPERHLKVFSDYLESEEIEWIDVKTALEELPVSLYGAIFTHMKADLARDICGQLELPTSGDLTELIPRCNVKLRASLTHVNRIQDVCYPRPERDGDRVDLKNRHADDVPLNGIAKVNRDSRGNIKSIEILSKNRQLRRVLVKACTYEESRGLRDEYWDKEGEGSGDEEEDDEEDEQEEQEEEEEEEEEEEKGDTEGEDDADMDLKSMHTLAPTFDFYDVCMARQMLTLSMDTQQVSKGDTWYERRDKKNKKEVRDTISAKTPPAGLDTLLKWLDVVAPLKPLADAILESDSSPIPNLFFSVITFEQLAHFYIPKTVVKANVASLGTNPVGFRVLNSYYQSESVDFIKTGRHRVWKFIIQLGFITSTGTCFIYSETSDSIGEFSDNIKKSLLPWKPADEESLKYLTSRGERFVTLSLGHNFRSYEPGAFRLTSHGNITISQPGRAMLDIVTAQQDQQYSGLTETGRRGRNQEGFNPGSAAQKDLDKWIDRTNNNRNAQKYGTEEKTPRNQIDQVSQNELCLCWPAVAAFSFTCKGWGYVMVDGVSDIDWNEKAFERLVLDQERKDLISAVVEHSETIFSDIISGKGGGSIFLLHGPPGTGKTLTAEAVAEVLHKPLYYVSVAELGTTPQDLESRLKTVLDLSSKWRAVLLMDEADIFLEQRGYQEITRNAMVGVILKLLEYYQGILFLTSNRVESFDIAFYSRITVALRYEPLNREIRASVWKMLFAAAGIDHLDENLFADYVMNGRQIKNCVALAQGLAKSQKRQVTEVDVNKTIRICMDFIKDMQIGQKRKVEMLEV